MDKTIFIAFSGGCFSGKTTTMLKAKDIFEDNGVNVVMLNEIVRERKIESITELRKNASAYLEFQEDVILKKINAEIEQKCIDTKKVVLCDRAITDSMFYLLFYTDKSKLTRKEIARFNALYYNVHNHAHYAFEHLYNVVFEFAPIKNINTTDKFRPDNIDILASIEHRFISTLNDAYDTSINCVREKIDLNACISVENRFKVMAKNIKKEWDR